MSTYWGLYCKLCQVGSGCGCKHTWKQEIQDLLDLAPELLALWKKDTEKILDIKAISLSFPWDEDSIIAFVLEHGTHKLDLYNEYNEHESIKLDT
jgi:hypothetical protein